MSVVVVDRGSVAAPATVGDRREPLIAPACLKIGALAAAAVVCGLLVVSARVRYNMFWTGDAPFFYAIARHPFASGHVWSHARQFGDAYRYGRILFPFTAWLLALGRPGWAGGALLVVYVVSFGAWVALAAEHMRRNGRSPVLALCLFALPFSFMAFYRPEAVSDPMAGALLFLVYLYERDGRTRAACVAASLLVLTREPLALALLPLVWMAWRRHGWRGLRGWVLALVPYLAWIVSLRVRFGHFPFLDPGVSRRQALSGPFLGYLKMLREGTDPSQKLGMVVAVATLAAVVAIVVRGRWRYPLTHGAVALAVVIPFLGIAVFRHPLEAFRVVVPLQALLLVVALDRGGVDRSEPPRPRLRLVA